MWEKHRTEYSIYSYKTEREKKEDLIRQIRNENKRRTLLRSFYRNI